VKMLGDQMTNSRISPASGEEKFYDANRLSCLDHLRQKTILLQSR
jgi:hypothetical protein